MAAEPAGRRARRGPAGAVAVALALLLATVAVDAVGGGKPEARTVSTALGFPRPVPARPATTATGFAVTVRSPPTPAGPAARRRRNGHKPPPPRE